MVLLASTSLLPASAALALAGLAMSCADSGASPTPGAAYGAPFVLNVGDAQAVGADGLTLRFEGVSADSRCPVDVTCVWEGEATVRIRAQAPSQDARTLDVRVRGTGGSGESDFGEIFKITVAKLEPAPVSRQPIAPAAYKATLVVSKR
jgi:hypothetical protein